MPVRVASVRRDAIATSVSSVGTVQALNTVLVRARVDGAIEQVIFKEGQIVTQGEVLVKLDARPFEAQLRASQAQRAKDAALLENAKTDLGRYEYLRCKTEARPRFSCAIPADRWSSNSLRRSRTMMRRSIWLVSPLSYTTITAPIAGRVGARLIDAGNIVHASDTTGLVVITQLKPIAINFAVPQDRLAELRAAQSRGPVAVSVLSEQGGPAVAEGQLVA